MEIENLRTMVRRANYKSFLSEVTVDDSSMENVKYPRNNDVLSNVDQELRANLSELTSQGREKKKVKLSVSKPTHGRSQVILLFGV